MDFDVIFMTGPQGSGKGTQGRRLAEKLGFFFWDTGAILREIIKEKTSLSEKVSVINQGVLLTDDLIIEILKEKLSAVSSERGVIFDGVPRRLGQAEFLIDFLKKRGKERFATILIDVPREETFKRLSVRAQKEGRMDDTLEAIDARLRQYHEAIQPTLEYLKKETTFFKVDGQQSVEEVEKEIFKALGII